MADRWAILGILAVAASAAGAVNDRSRGERPAAGRAGAPCDLAVEGIVVSGPKRVEAWVESRGTGDCPATVAALRLLGKDGRPSRPEYSDSVAAVAKGRRLRAAFDLPFALSPGQRVTVAADVTSLVTEADEDNNQAAFTVTEVPEPTQVPTAAATRPPRTPRPNAGSGSARADLGAQEIAFYEKEGRRQVRGVVHNHGEVDFVGARKVSLYRRPILADGGGEDELVVSDRVNDVPAGTEIAIHSRVPPGVRGARGYVWSLVITPGDDNPDNDSVRKEMKQVILD